MTESKDLYSENTPKSMQNYFTYQKHFSVFAGFFEKSVKHLNKKWVRLGPFRYFGSILKYQIQGFKSFFDNLTCVDNKPFNSPGSKYSNFSIFERDTRSKSDHNPYDKR